MASSNNRQEKIKLLTFGGMAVAFLLYSGFVYQADVPESEVLLRASAEVKAGKALWQENNCGSCHQFYGLGGYLGPDLTNVLSAKGKGPEYARAIITHGTDQMPNFGLQPEEVNALLAFLNHVDQTGRGSVHDYTPQPDGTISPTTKTKSHE